MTAGEYLEQEALCRRLAAQTTDDELRRHLLDVADEYAAAAQGFEEAKPRPPLSGS